MEKLIVYRQLVFGVVGQAKYIQSRVNKTEQLILHSIDNISSIETMFWSVASDVIF